jgi:hypothetical protein
LKHIKRGEKGIAEFIVEKLSRRAKTGVILLNCTDLSRRQVKYRDNDGNKICDLNAEQLISKIKGPIGEVVNELTKNPDELGLSGEDEDVVLSRYTTYNIKARKFGTVFVNVLLNGTHNLMKKEDEKFKEIILED